jgi:hypothetical protein
MTCTTRRHPLDNPSTVIELPRIRLDCILCPNLRPIINALESNEEVIQSHLDKDIESVKTPDGAEPGERLTLTMSPVGLTMRLRERDPDAGGGA